MKKILFLAAVMISGFTMMAQKPEDVIKVNADSYDFGKIKQGVPVTTYFTLTNISDKPVVIENAWASCGCTTPEWSKEPIAPKSTTKIKVGYNAANAMPFTKEVYVKLAGMQQPKIVKITGTVLTATDYETYTKSDEFKQAEKSKSKKASKK